MSPPKRKGIPIKKPYTDPDLMAPAENPLENPLEKPVAEKSIPTAETPLGTERGEKGRQQRMKPGMKQGLRRNLPSGDLGRKEEQITVFRVKRKREEERPDVIVVEEQKPKRPKGKDQGQDESSSQPAILRQVFRFADTIPLSDKVDTGRTKALKDLIKERLKTPLKEETTKTSPAKNLKLAEKQQQSSRYRLIQEKRGQQGGGKRLADPRGSSDSSDAMKEVFHLYDVVREDADMEEEFLEPTQEDLEAMPQKYRDILCNSLPLLRSLSLKEDEYVYDVYYRTSQRPGDAEVFQGAAYMQVESLPDDDLVFGPGSDEEEGNYVDEDEDSNDESHWKNDYPDEDEGALTDEEGRPTRRRRSGSYDLEGSGEDELSDDDARLEGYYGFEEEDMGDYHYYDQGDDDDEGDYDFE